jgi:hypothetical protein
MLFLFLTGTLLVNITFGAGLSQKEIRAKLENASGWVAYKAFRQRNTSLCESSSSNQDCWEVVNQLVFLRSLAKGNCTNLPSQYAGYQDACVALNQQRCSSLPGYKKSLCEAILSGNVSAMERVYSDPEFPEFVNRKKEAAEKVINIYYGFKNKSEADCGHFTSDNLLLSASCNMLFGNQGFTNKLDAISQDIYYALQAKESNEPRLCSKISNGAIRKACNDNSVKDLNGILDAVWH